jgi:hypothetical protein
MRRLLCALALVAFAAAPALADPKSDIMSAMITFGRATSYHMDITAKGHTMAGDIAPPNKMHMSSAEFEMIKIDSTIWIKIGGSWRKMNFPGADQMTAAYTSALETAKSAPDDLIVTDLGMKVPASGGAPLHAYTVTNKAGKSPSTMFLDGSTFVEADTTDGSSIRFSKFNVPVDISPPS